MKLKPWKPVPIKKFLTTALPALYHKPKRRAAAWREFAKSDSAAGHHFALGDKWHTVKEFADWLNDGNEIPNELTYYVLLYSFLSWYADWRRGKTSEERSRAGRKAHKKTGARPNRVALQKVLRARGLLT